jgi:transcriptional regulator with XRE-family HTH domain
MTLTDQIRSALIARPESFREIASELNIHVSQLTRFAKKERGLSLDSIDRLAKYLGLALKPDKS